MIYCAEYDIALPPLYQVKNGHKIVTCASSAQITDQVEPIPISFWWLRVFGFERVLNESLEEYALTLPTNKKYIVYRDSNNNWFGMTSKGFSKVNHVHELQEGYSSLLIN